MEQIELTEPQKKYAEDIWKFRQEILDYDAENESQFAGCISLDVSKSAEEWIKICELRKSGKTCEEVGTTVPGSLTVSLHPHFSELQYTQGFKPSFFVKFIVFLCSVCSVYSVIVL